MAKPIKYTICLVVSHSYSFIIHTHNHYTLYIFKFNEVEYENRRRKTRAYELYEFVSNFLSRMNENKNTKNKIVFGLHVEVAIIFWIYFALMTYSAFCARFI